MATQLDPSVPLEVFSFFHIYCLSLQDHWCPSGTNAVPAHGNWILCCRIPQGEYSACKWNILVIIILVMGIGIKAAVSKLLWYKYAQGLPTKRTTCNYPQWMLHHSGGYENLIEKLNILSRSWLLWNLGNISGVFMEELPCSFLWYNSEGFFYFFQYHQLFLLQNNPAEIECRWCMTCGALQKS